MDDPTIQTVNASSGEVPVPEFVCSCACSQEMEKISLEKLELSRARNEFSNDKERLSRLREKFSFWRASAGTVGREDART